MKTLITFSERLQYRMQQLKKSKPDIYQHPLAGTANISKQNVQQWLDGSGISSKKLSVLAKILNTTESWLIDGDGDCESQKGNTFKPLIEKYAINQYPVLQWEQADSWRSTAMENSNYISTPIKGSKDSFVIEVKGISMLPKFEEGSLVVVDPNVKPNSLEYGLYANNSSIMIRQFISENNESLLKAINPDWPSKIEVMSAETRLIGAILGVWTPLTKPQ